jgi:predicted secreted hydrolase
MISALLSFRQRWIRSPASVGSFALCGAGWLLMTCTLFSADSSAAEFTSATAGYQFQFPRDHGSHPAYRTEWWYYTGHLQAKDGRSFGYELTFFRRAIPADEVKTLPSQWSVSELYLAHFAVTDIKGHRFHFSEKISRAGLGKAGADESDVHVWIDDWHAAASPDADASQHVAARDKDYAIALTLAPAKPLVIHGMDGVSVKGTEAGQASHYYSFTRLLTTGMLTIGNESIPVTGTSWMDHEFGSADLGKDVVGWDWFSIQLTDNRELMLYCLRRSDGSPDRVSSGTVVAADGHARHLRLEDFHIEATSSWTSPASQAVYPSQWHIVIPSLNLALDVRPLVAEQELRTSRSTQVIYWEGAVAVTGTEQGQPIKGDGYVELTGYASRQKL